MSIVMLDPPLRPRSGVGLNVLLICRISGLSQDEKALCDQEQMYRRWLADRTDLPCQIEVIATRGSGEHLDREEFGRAIERVESGEVDLVLTEDLGRICRRVHAHIFCETCEDHDTRLVAINDHVDTGRDDWRLGSFFAVMRHETYNKDTSNRIRRTLRNRFRQGGILQFVIYGYIKPLGAKSEMELQKDPAAEEILKEWFERLDNGASFSEIADWLNSKGVSPGRYCRKTRWDCAMVGRVTRNPILKGQRVRNNMMARRVNKTGRHRSVKAPHEERIERDCPHLAFFEPSYYDRIIRKVNERNSKYRRRGVNGIDSRIGVPRKRTIWPGQQLRCGVCGRLFYWSGTESKRVLMCSGACEYKCWNSVALDGMMASAKLVNAVFAEIRSLPEFDTTFVAMIEERSRNARDQNGRRRRDLLQRRTEVSRQIDRVTAAIAGMGGSRALTERLQVLESELDQIDDELEAINQGVPTEILLPSVAEIIEIAEDRFRGLARESPEFSRLLQSLVTGLTARPYRHIDGGAVVLRATFSLRLAPLVPSLKRVAELDNVLARPMSVDLFDLPQRVAFRERVVELRAQDLKYSEIGTQLGISGTAAQRAAELDRMIKDRGLTDPYVALVEPPVHGKLRRHRHTRYRFEPLNAQTG